MLFASSVSVFSAADFSLDINSSCLLSFVCRFSMYKFCVSCSSFMSETFSCNVEIFDLFVSLSFFNMFISDLFCVLSVSNVFTLFFKLAISVSAVPCPPCKSSIFFCISATSSALLFTTCLISFISSSTTLFLRATDASFCIPVLFSNVIFVTAI